MTARSFASKTHLLFYRLPIKKPVTFCTESLTFSHLGNSHSLLSHLIIVIITPYRPIASPITHLNGHGHLARNVNEEQGMYVRQKVIYTWTVTVKIFLDDTNEKSRPVGLRSNGWKEV